MQHFCCGFFPSCDELVEHGATIGETPTAVVWKCKYTIAMLSDPSATISVAFDKAGVLEEICNGKGYIDMSTVDADTSVKISEGVTSKGGRFLEGPVSGSKKPAEDGQLIILAAGEKVYTPGNAPYASVEIDVVREQLAKFLPTSIYYWPERAWSSCLILKCMRTLKLESTNI
ncbi:glyoxylate/succinic semialdehyde reductase 1-like isoform X1 [Spinacia oleracea]|uniref:Glyoxylate/succinic semialdehyde reductase 1-like isoform X1 n=2 Tax=Spinacia oleracea TaxID=3562 RepID=A0ABM3R784_SPIOL|nr:glyoxylate/succinic semialdehyde reductase 1-like isoform X1 [Spinacia oleracea]